MNFALKMIEAAVRACAQANERPIRRVYLPPYIWRELRNDDEFAKLAYRGGGMSSRNGFFIHNVEVVPGLEDEIRFVLEER